MHGITRQLRVTRIGDYHFARPRFVTPCKRDLVTESGDGATEDVEAWTEVTNPAGRENPHLLGRREARHRGRKDVMGRERCHNVARHNSR